jgi:hypothetical protein
MHLSIVARRRYLEKTQQESIAIRSCFRRQYFSQAMSFDAIFIASDKIMSVAERFEWNSYPARLLSPLCEIMSLPAAASEICATLLIVATTFVGASNCLSH